MAQIKLNLDETLKALEIGAVSIALNRNPNWRVKGVRFRLGGSGLEGAIVEVEAVEKSDET